MNGGIFVLEIRQTVCNIFSHIFRSSIENEMSFSSRLRIKKNIALPINENTNLFTNNYFNSERNYTNGQIRGSIPVTHVRRPQQSENEIQTQYSSMSSNDISNASVGCIIPSTLRDDLIVRVC